jgi:hypothetical protein
MELIHQRLPFDDFDPFPFTNIFQDLDDTFFILVVNDLAMIFGCKYDVVFTQPLGVGALLSKGRLLAMEITPISFGGLNTTILLE